MLKYLKIFFLLIYLGLETFAQPDLRIDPNTVRFKDIFSRIGYTTFINRGNQPLIVDSLSVQKDFYIIDFEGGQTLPFTLNPNDSIKMNVLLSNYYNITVSDTLDTLYVYSNDPSSPEDVRIKIDFFDDDRRGICAGTIADGVLNPIQDATVYFLYAGVYILDSAKTDLNGFYSKPLPEGSYTLAAEKDGFRTMFYGNTPDPFFAYQVDIDSGQTLNLNFSLPPITSTGLSLSGKMIDSTSNTIIEKGVVIIRKGNHTPTLLKGTNQLVDSAVYSGFVQPDGTFDIIVEDSTYYYLQGFSDYYLPTYYSSKNGSSIFWQNADSLYVNTQLTNKDLYLVRDSSYGGGLASGFVNVPFSDAGSLDGITIFAKSVTNGNLYSYNFGRYDGTFLLNNIPYGTYQLIAQKTGYPNATSDQFVIDPLNPQTQNITLTFNLSSVDEDDNQPKDFILYQNYPNPFNPSTQISFELNSSSFVTLKIFNLLGEEVAILIDGMRNAGRQSIVFYADDLPSGVYFYSLQTDNNIYQTKKMLLLK